MDDSTRQQVTAKRAELVDQMENMKAAATRLHDDMQAVSGAIQMCDLLLVEEPPEPEPPPKD